MIDSQIGVVSAENILVTEGKHAATQWRRLANYLLDGLFAWIFGSIAGFVLGLIAGAQDLPSDTYLPNDLILTAFSFLLSIVYFVVFESVWQRTPAKWITKTKVVMLDGSKAGFWRIVGRTFARVIPFEQISYLFGKYPYGWHDALTKTTVVSASYTADDMKLVNVHDKGKGSVGLVVLGLLLPFIAILGILASVVLASLNTARDKSADAAIKSNMSLLHPQAELYFDTNSTYEGFCASERAISFLESSREVSVEGISYVCNDEQDSWAAAIPLKSKGDWCVDSSGVSDPIGAPLGNRALCVEKILGVGGQVS